MKKTFTINICGTVFHIEEDAYEKLQNYLLKLKQHFGTNDEGKEIVTDFEARISELFNEKISGDKSVVVLAWVDEVIETMGTPDDFIEAEGDEEEPIHVKRKRRLYRDPDHRVIGGVCGGLGAYFNIDPVVLRIIFVVLFLAQGIGLIAYVILWIAVPKAINTAQRLEMRGKEVTISNIEKSIKEEVKDVTESVKNLKDSKGYAKGQDAVSQFGDVVYNILKVVLKVFIIIVGVVLILSGFFGLIGFISSLIVGQSFVSGVPMIWGPEIHVPGILNHFVTPGTVTFGMISIAFLVGIPLLAMLYIGTKLVFRYKSNNTLIGLGMVGVWLIALVAIVVLSVSQVGNYKNRASVTNSMAITCEGCNTLYLELNKDSYEEYDELDWDIEDFKIGLVDGEEVLLSQPTFDIEKSSSNNFVIVIKSSSRGKNREMAKDYSKEIEYNYEIKDSTLFLDSYFSLGQDGKFRDQDVDIILKVPEGKQVFLSDDMIHIIHDIENVSNTWDGDMVGKYWVMTPEGLAKSKKSE